MPADSAGEPSDDEGDGGGCNAGGEAVGGAFILVVLAVIWLLAWNRTRRSDS
jgi:uncharacterized protein (TIGR03382 family)